MKPHRAFKKIWRSFGWQGLPAGLRQLVSRGNPVTTLMSPHCKAPVHFRLGTTDISIYHQIFVDREYDIALNLDPAVIVDAGANIGFASLYFARRFPRARIIALEPEESNFVVLRRNTAALPNISLRQQALWHERTRLDLYDPGPGRAGMQKDGFQTFDPQSGAAPSVATQVEAVCLDDLMSELQIDQIDILKIDIEGSEREVFQHAGAWLDRTQVIIAELHDRMRFGCSRAFYPAVDRFEMEMHRGENVVVGRRGTLGAGSMSRAIA